LCAAPHCGAARAAHRGRTIRSFRLNDDANLNVYDAGFAARQSQVFEDDLKQARRITYESWKNGPLTDKLREHALALFGSLL
jgi:cardiolipin synthase